MTERIGILGGTFDPIHLGHINFAMTAKKTCGLDTVLVMPAGNPVYKQNLSVTDAKHRLAMCKLATKKYPVLQVSSMEVDRPGKTYTSDTLQEVHRIYPQAKLFFIAGADAAKTIPVWHESNVIASLAHIVVAKRPGFSCSVSSQDKFDSRFKLIFIDVQEFDISSTDVRLRCRLGLPISDFVNKQVEDYIVANNLYV